MPYAGQNIVNATKLTRSSDLRVEQWVLEHSKRNCTMIFLKSKSPDHFHVDKAQVRHQNDVWIRGSAATTFFRVNATINIPVSEIV